MSNKLVKVKRIFFSPKRSLTLYSKSILEHFVEDYKVPVIKKGSEKQTAD